MKIISPISVVRTRKTKGDKKYHINLNGYRNWHFQVSNDLKTKYCEVMRDALEGLKFQTPIVIRFTLHRGLKLRKADRSNVLSVIEKFFCDTLVHYQCIPDDSDEFIESTHYFTGEVDRENPRVEIDVIEPKNDC